MPIPGVGLTNDYEGVDVRAVRSIKDVGVVLVECLRRSSPRRDAQQVGGQLLLVIVEKIDHGLLVGLVKSMTAPLLGSEKDVAQPPAARRYSSILGLWGRGGGPSVGWSG